MKGLVPVKGKITLDGSPIEGAAITLSPKSTGENARAAGATSDASGEFKIQTMMPADGAFPGEYSITVRKMVPDKVYTEEEQAAANAKGVSLPSGANNLLPKKYETVRTSGLKVTVVEGKNEDLILELTSK
ncbi:MAG: carboxypeptidase-like regulatory domain-containing protein [Planctomycetaceae bacterium]|nr:carboxypeptidase-like regulatory domain-containing protein [Planctomycetaceae bacterium]